MVDFRYHLVSLVAVFIALAVGIALGAGPLREGISSTLESEVADLRSERTELRAQVDAADVRAEAKDAALDVSAERLASGSLTDVRVGLVLLPGADRNTVDQLEDSVESAGARLALSLDMSARWEDPERLNEHAEWVAQHSQSLELPSPRRTDQVGLATVLAAVLSAQDRPGLVGSWVSVAGELDDSGVLDLRWFDRTVDDMLDRRPADVIVILSGGLTQAQADQEPGAERLQQRLDLVEALTRTGVPVVIAGEGGDSQLVEGVLPVDPLITQIRLDRDLADEVSTIDNLESASGRLATTLATAWEAVGESGHYGTAPDAEAALPAPPPPRSEPTEEAPPTEPVPEPTTSPGQILPDEPGEVNQDTGGLPTGEGGTPSDSTGGHSTESDSETVPGSGDEVEVEPGTDEPATSEEGVDQTSAP